MERDEEQKAKPAFKDLTGWGKTKVVLKIVVSILSFGFIFPSVD